MIRESAVEIDMPDHIPRIIATDGHAGNALTSSNFHAPFFGWTFGILRRIKCLPHIRLKRILDEIIVRGANVGVAEQALRNLER